MNLSLFNELYIIRKKAMKYKLLKKKDIFILDESLGGKIFAGNKFRKSKYLLNLPIKKGVITIGSKYSNHSLAMAHYCKLLNKKFTYLLIEKNKISQKKYSNIRLIKDLNAEVIQIKSSEAKKKINFYKNKYKGYMWIPGGGSNKQALDQYFKLAKKVFIENKKKLSKIKLILLPWGTGTTAIGFHKAIEYLNLNINIIAISVSRTKKKCIKEISNIYSLKRKKLIEINDDYAGKYGKKLKDDSLFRKLFTKEFGVKIDPIYNSRSIRYFYKKKLKDCLIINTGGLANNLND